MINQRELFDRIVRDGMQIESEQILPDYRLCLLLLDSNNA